MASLGTVLALAFVVWNTVLASRSARAAGGAAEAAREEAAGAWRPLIVPTGRFVVQVKATSGESGAEEAAFLDIAIRNEGRGPALQVVVELQAGDEIKVDLLPGQVEHDELALLKQDDERKVRRVWPGDAIPHEYRLRIDYVDLGGRVYSTKATFVAEERQRYEDWNVSFDMAHLRMDLLSFPAGRFETVTRGGFD